MPDIVVVGGGLTGLMTALTLSHSPYQTAHIQRQQGDGNRETIRTTTISAAGRRMLETLGVWQHLNAAPTPIELLKVADGEPSTGINARRSKAFDLECKTGMSRWPCRAERHSADSARASNAGCECRAPDRRDGS